jgi:hypothetical protein
MAAAAPSFLPRHMARLFAWPRLRLALLVPLPFGLLMSIDSVTPTRVWLLRSVIVGVSAMLGFGIFERWPERTRRSRWVVQLFGVVAAVPLGGAIAYWITTGELWFLTEAPRYVGYFSLTFLGLFFAPWIALAAMVGQREAFAREQALAFQLERSRLERQAIDARLNLMQAQVQPHFLFNTLANVRALVNAGSPQAVAVLDSLIAYLRAAVPRLDETFTTLGQEIELVRAYLELMHLRMPDRLQFAIHAEPAAMPLRCPPMSLLTLVENAVRHGIDPSEEGGRIEVSVSLHEGRCIARVVDTGVGLQQGVGGLGTGLTTLRERLQLAFGAEARLSLTGLVPHGVSAEIEFPAQRETRSTVP